MLVEQYDTITIGHHANPGDRKIKFGKTKGNGHRGTLYLRNVSYPPLLARFERVTHPVSKSSMAYFSSSPLVYLETPFEMHLVILRNHPHSPESRRPCSPRQSFLR